MLAHFKDVVSPGLGAAVPSLVFILAFAILVIRERKQTKKIDRYKEQRPRKIL